MQFLRAFNWLCLLGASVLAQSSQSITTDVSVLPAVVTTTIAARPTFLGDKPDFSYRWTSISTEVEAATSNNSKYRRPTTSSELNDKPKEKYTRNIESSSRSTKFPKYTRSPAAQAATRTSDLPDCVPVCSENASVFTDCDEDGKDCVCLDHQFQKILYHCLKSICEPEKLSYAVQFVTGECSPYLPKGKEGGTILFYDIKAHQQEELHQLYARKNLGSGFASGARPNGPTALPFPKKVNEGHNVEVLVTTFVTEYVGETLYPHATAGLGPSDGKNAHGHKHLRRTKRHH
ncbi:hypothetical protein EV426DRAFT_603121 [Tirmania nivea]|nr:hypothetical protein EV426DRAFT_603121 [Tirmania nivea]